MTPDQLAALAAEIDADPALAATLPGEPGHAVARLNAPEHEMVRSRFVTARTVIAELGTDGAMAMEKLVRFGALAPLEDEAAERLRATTRWAMVFVASEGGLDLGHPTSQLLLDALAAAHVLDEAEAAALKSLALRPASRAEQLFGEGATVTEADLRAAQEIL